MIGLALKKQPPYRVLCLGSHADDIEIGCGGTVLKLIDEYPGQIIARWIVLSAAPERAREAKGSAEAFLREAAEKTVVVENFPDSFFLYQSGGEIKKYMHQLSRDFSPDLIFTHYRQDLHQDHRLIAELTWNAFRDHWILEYEIPKYDADLGSPNVFVPLSETVCRTKVNYLLEYFKSQTQRKWFSGETFAALHRLRGIECNSPSGYAEAFHCRKVVWSAQSQ
jgi:LmbE family N-acetylglucosaminyl deacetylase